MIKGLDMNSVISKILSSTRRALIGEITQNMRAVYVALENYTIKILFIYNGKITDDDQDNVGYIGSLIVSDFNEYKIDEKAIRIDYPKVFILPKNYILVYRLEEVVAKNTDNIIVDLEKLKLVEDWCIYEI
ncbi:hypothetical protein LMG7974_01918 [Campylobacter majalis]|uniref:Uncharacterized protein n=2 Tax=Campylobacter majalis TaxID=2790656 RepID=A0ABN7KCN4_9BACT|nr:hypothetical protein LMG7974_01918 [Campylobacter majalis]